MSQISDKKVLSRQEKRHTLIRYKGKSYKASEWLKVAAEELPKMKFADGKPVDHYAELKHFYMKDGIKGANAYINHIRKVLNLDYRKFKIEKFWKKVKAFFKIK